ncbi:MAG: glycosyltransferase [Burkholderiales bacterium]|nr:glycosyltransferase [Burkholderiales bacterium]
MLYLKHFPASGTPLIGGTSVAVDGLASGLAANGAQVTVLCEGPRPGAVKCAAGYTIECCLNRKRYRTFAVSPAMRRRVVEQLEGQRGLCVLNGIFHPSVYGLARWLHRHRVPYVVAPHDPYDRAMPVIETPNGVAVNSTGDASRLHWRHPREPVHLLFLGRMDAYNKGLDVLLEAFSHLNAETRAKLTLQGPDGGDRSRLEKQAAKRSLDGSVAFQPADYSRPSHEVIADHDLFCLPSRFEGFGLAALEAMLAARVLLVSERAGIARHVEASGCGVCVQPTVSGVVEGFRQLMRRRTQWREMGLSGRRYALTHLQWQNIAGAALERYAELLS